MRIVSRFLPLALALAPAFALASPPSFIAPVTSQTAPVYLFDAAVADLDADGSDDVVVMSDFGVLTWWRGDGAGSIELAWTTSLTGTADRVLAADLDADGWPDVVTAGDSVRVHFGAGGGALEAPITLGQGSEAWIGQITGTAALDIAAAIWPAYSRARPA